MAQHCCSGSCRNNASSKHNRSIADNPVPLRSNQESLALLCLEQEAKNAMVKVARYEYADAPDARAMARARMGR